MRNPRLWAGALALVFAVSLSDSLLHMPIQESDSIELLLEAQRAPSATALFWATLSSPGFMRPMFRAQNKVLLDMVGVVSPQAVFRGFHALLLSASLLLFAWTARVSTPRDFAAFALALTVLVGLHTFRGTVQSAYPVNHYLNVLVVCLLTLALAQSSGSYWGDALAISGFAYAVMILETGALVWVTAVAAWAVGWRGISKRALGLMTALMAGYIYLRFVHLPTGVPALSERSTGYLFTVLDPPELQRRFGAHPATLYAYNVATSILSVFLSEPRAGRFVALGAWLQGAMVPGMVVAMVTSFFTTATVGAVAVRALRARAIDDNARYVAVFVAVLLGNAVISFPYTKDEILIPAGVFYALAAYAGWRTVLNVACGPRRLVGAAMVLLLAAMSAGWTVRAAGIHYVMRSQAFKQRGDWAELPGEWRRTGQWPTDAGAAHLVETLRHDALATPAPNPRFEPTWARLVWEE